jgi:DeoR family transcriptional regulator, aga operon transcriptional repressor
VSCEATEPPIPASLRRERMLAEIEEREFVRVGELSSRFGVSAVTVRGDLDSLAARGKVHRVRGGAIPRLMPRQEQPFEDSISSFAAEKVAIAQARRCSSTSGRRRQQQLARSRRGRSSATWSSSRTG